MLFLHVFSILRYKVIKCRVELNLSSDWITPFQYRTRLNKIIFLKYNWNFIDYPQKVKNWYELKSNGWIVDFEIFLLNSSLYLLNSAEAFDVFYLKDF